MLSGRWVTRFPPSFCGRPPLDDVRDYFGEKTAFYFAFMHHYTTWLLRLGLPALIALLLQIIPSSHACPHDQAEHLAAVEEVLESAGPAPPAPVLTCAVGGVDHALVPFFGVYAALWAVYFLKYWRRYASELEYRWDVSDFAAEEPTRPEFHRHKSTRHDRTGFYSKAAGFMPFGDVPTPYFPGSERSGRFGAGMALTLLLMLVIVIGTLAIFAIKLAMAQGDTLSRVRPGTAVFGFAVSPAMVASIIAASLNTIFIGVFNVIYRHLGILLTDWENHRTESEYENSLILKNSIFQFVNSYISFFYIAFVKSSKPNLFGIRDGEGPDAQPVFDECNGGDCMRDLVVQMLVVVFVKQFFRNAMSSLVPTLRSLFMKTSVPHDELAGVEKLTHESKLPKSRQVYWEFNEMAIQFGYVTMFAAAAPWAATLCLVNNAIERKADAMNMLYGRQRPSYVGASSIGAWSTVFEVLSFLAIVSNIAIVGVTSHSLGEIYQLNRQQVLWMCLILEHSILVLKFYVQVRVNDAPLWVIKANAYQEWLVSRGEEDVKPTQRDMDKLQAVYDDDDDLERFFL